MFSYNLCTVYTTERITVSQRDSFKSVLDNCQFLSRESLYEQKKSTFNIVKPTSRTKSSNSNSKAMMNYAEVILVLNLAE